MNRGSGMWTQVTVMNARVLGHPQPQQGEPQGTFLSC